MQKTKKALKKVVTASKSTMAGRSKDAAVKAQKPAKKPSPAVQAAKKAPTSVKKTVIVKKAAPAKKAGAAKKDAPKSSVKGAAKESVKKAPTPKAAAKPGNSKDSKKKVVGAKAAAPKNESDAKSESKSELKSVLKTEPKKEAPKGERKYAKKPTPKGDDDLDAGDDVLDSDDLDVGGDEIIETKASTKSATAKSKKTEVEKEASADDEVFLTDAEGRRYCRVRDCDQIASVDNGYCRYHYLLYWRNIQNRKKILSEGKLERYIEELTARYPDKYLELLRKDLRSEKDFMSAIQELEIDESGNDSEFEDEAQSYLDEVRGMGSETTNDREEDF